MTYKLANTSRDADPYFGAVSLLLDGTDLQDKSLDTKAITVNGDAQVSTAQSKWNGSSLAFDGTGDYLSIPNSSDFRMGSDPFTIEGYLYINSASGENGIVNLYGYTNNRRSYSVELSAGNFRFRTSSNGSTPATTVFSYSGTPLQQWFHFAVVKSSTTGALYINGVRVISGTADATLYDNTVDDLIIGNIGPYGASYYFNGYIQDLRITKGVARYTTPTFTLPTQPFTPAAVAPDYDPYFFTNVSLLLKGDGTNGSTNIVDSSYPAKTITVNGDAQISTAQSKFGGSSLYFDGTGDYIYSYSNADFQFGTGDFTVELWARFSAISNQLLFDTIQIGGSGSRGAGFAWVLQSTGSLNVFSANNFRGATTTTLSANQWYHLAICRNNGQWYYFINGVQDSTQFTHTLNLTNDNFLCGRVGDSSSYFVNGYIDDLRITKGVARYTSNFTPPTKALPDY